MVVDSKEEDEWGRRWHGEASVFHIRLRKEKRAKVVTF